MGKKLSQIVALAFAITPGTSNAMGFGEIKLLSRIGERLTAEVPILSTTKEPLSTACFTLTALPGSEFPVITAARVLLIRRQDQYFVQINGAKTVSDPIFAIGLRAECGHALQRDYILMPEAPIMLPETSDSPPSEPKARPGKLTDEQSHDGQTLKHVADVIAPANPVIKQNDSLAEGKSGSISERKRPKKNRSLAPVAGEEQPLHDRDDRSITHSRTEAIGASSTPPREKIDRLVLRAPPEEERPHAKGSSAPVTLAETEERIRILEIKLQRLTQEMEKTDEALALATKAIEAQNKMQPVNTAPISSQSGVTKVHPPAPTASLVPSNWFGLLLGAVVGAGVVFGSTHYLGRRRRRPDEKEAPLALAGHRSEIAPNGQPYKSPSLPVKSGATKYAVPISTTPSVLAAPEEKTSRHPEPDNVEMRSEDDNSLLELAEIMLSFGRVQTAADTLAEYIDQVTPESFQPWSMVLDLYRRGGMREEFDALATKMRSRFNANIPDWNDSKTPISGLKTLEDYPHVIHIAQSVWGTQACISYLYSLVNDNRAGQRNGFPLEVIEEIALLLQVLESAYQLQREA